ncbi:MAG: putative transposase [Candidatus Paceibacteria bacterium]|jgi:putative transposase
MPRPKRLDIASQIYHVLNRANARLQIFDQQIDYEEYLETLNEGLNKFDVNLYSYEIMPNHWHHVMSPKKDGELSRLMHWVSMTHTQRWHARRGTRGSGHFYQGRFKSFLI